MIAIVDYKGQYVHRIWRSLREIGVESKIVPYSTPLREVKDMNPEAIVLSGGPYSVYDDEGILGDFRGFIDSGLPVLGICLGHQIIGRAFGGEVKRGESGEYAAVEIEVLEEDDLFKGVGKNLVVWESHRDEVSKLPEDFILLAKSDVCAVEAMKHKAKRIYGVQFHPEVHHTPQGFDILKNFVSVCAVKK
ncbi:MAG: GMP synthase subunit A [Candidatus Altiarchaeota archaeon]|nr:GMP synthase subunit A [Candidatus Altiarchaeota archaeon]